MRAARAALATAAIAALPVLAACQPSADGLSAAQSSASAALSSASAAMSSASAAASSAASAALGSASAAAGSPSQAATATSGAGTQGVAFTMPDEVGTVLQDAQNALHADGVFSSRSHDLLGSRHQVLDRDWKVCSQNVPAGQKVTGNAEGVIDFGVVKRSESCP